jgi:hypothetical protein
MKADPSLAGWGGWSAPPPTAGGGRAIIQRWMKSVAHHLANWRVGAHVRRAPPPFLHKGTSFSLSCRLHDGYVQNGLLKFA